MKTTELGSVAKITRLHRNDYQRLCVREIMKRDGITKWPGDGPIWVESYDMTEEIYGSLEANYIWPCRAKSSRIAADPTLTHAQKVPLIEALHIEWEKQYRVREAKREAAKTPEQRAREKKNGEALDRWLQPTMDALGDTEYEATPEIIEVAERPFDEHLTDAGRISVRGLGIRLD